MPRTCAPRRRGRWRGARALGRRAPSRAAGAGRRCRNEARRRLAANGGPRQWAVISRRGGAPHPGGAMAEGGAATVGGVVTPLWRRCLDGWMAMGRRVVSRPAVSRPLPILDKIPLLIRSIGIGEGQAGVYIWFLTDSSIVCTESGIAVPMEAVTISIGSAIIDGPICCP